MGARLAAVAVAAALAACSGAGDALPDARLPSLGGPAGPSLASCPTERCLTVLVAPWCGVCHAVAPDVVRLRRHLDAKGVASRVIVGLDKPSALRDFAGRFGPDALLDEEGVLKARSVPAFVVSDRSGRVLKRVAGFPRDASDLDQLAAFFGLP